MSNQNSGLSDEENARFAEIAKNFEGNTPGQGWGQEGNEHAAAVAGANGTVDVFPRMDRYDPTSLLTEAEFDLILANPAHYRPVLLSRLEAGNLQTPTGKFIFLTSEHQDHFGDFFLEHVKSGDTAVLVDAGIYHDPDPGIYMPSNSNIIGLGDPNDFCIDVGLHLEGKSRSRISNVKLLKKPDYLALKAKVDNLHLILSRVHFQLPNTFDESLMLWAEGEVRLDMFDCFFPYPVDWEKYPIAIRDGIDLYAKDCALSFMSVTGEKTRATLDNCFTQSLKVAQGAKVKTRNGIFCGVNKSKTLYDLRVQGEQAVLVVDCLRGGMMEDLELVAEDGVLVVSSADGVPEIAKVKAIEIGRSAYITLPERENNIFSRR